MLKHENCDFDATYWRVPLQSAHGSRLRFGDGVDECFKFLGVEMGDVLAEDATEGVNDLSFAEKLETVVVWLTASRQ
jgi:hypothetical protein